jgi:predicted transcriptional regulator
MTKRQRLMERVAGLPDSLLSAVAGSIEAIVVWHQRSVYHLSDDERAAVRKGMEAARRGEFVPDEEMTAFYNRHSL